METNTSFKAPAPFHTWTEYGVWINLRRNEAIMHVAAADDSMAFVTRDGTLMFWKDWMYRRPELTQLLRGTRITQIARLYACCRETFP